SRFRSTRSRRSIRHGGGSCSGMSVATAAAPARNAERPRPRRGYARTSRPQPARKRHTLAAKRITDDALVASWQRALDAAGDALRAAVADHALSATEARELERRLAAERHWLARCAIRSRPQGSPE